MKKLSYDESRLIYMKKKRDYFGYSFYNSAYHLRSFLEECDNKDFLNFVLTTNENKNIL